VRLSTFIYLGIMSITLTLVGVLGYSAEMSAIRIVMVEALLIILFSFKLVGMQERDRAWARARQPSTDPEDSDDDTDEQVTRAVQAGNTGSIRQNKVIELTAPEYCRGTTVDTGADIDESDEPTDSGETDGRPTEDCPVISIHQARKQTLLGDDEAFLTATIRWAWLTDHDPEDDGVPNVILYQLSTRPGPQPLVGSEAGFLVRQLREIADELEERLASGARE